MIEQSCFGSILKMLQCFVLVDHLEEEETNCLRDS